MNTTDFELTDPELDEVDRHREGDTFTSVVASYHLFLFDVGFVLPRLSKS
jgi:hypothetical protein